MGLRLSPGGCCCGGCYGMAPAVAPLTVTWPGGFPAIIPAAQTGQSGDLPQYYASYTAAPAPPASLQLRPTSLPWPYGAATGATVYYGSATVGSITLRAYYFDGSTSTLLGSYVGDYTLKGWYRCLSGAPGGGQLSLILAYDQPAALAALEGAFGPHFPAAEAHLRWPLFEGLALYRLVGGLPQPSTLGPIPLLLGSMAGEDYFASAPSAHWFAVPYDFGGGAATAYAVAEVDAMQP